MYIVFCLFILSCSNSIEPFKEKTWFNIPSELPTDTGEPCSPSDTDTGEVSDTGEPELPTDTGEVSDTGEPELPTDTGEVSDTGEPELPTDTGEVSDTGDYGTDTRSYEDTEYCDNEHAGWECVHRDDCIDKMIRTDYYCMLETSVCCAPDIEPWPTIN